MFLVKGTAYEGSNLQDKVVVASGSVGGLLVQFGMCSVGIKFRRGLDAGVSRMDPSYYRASSETCASRGFSQIILAGLMYPPRKRNS